MRGDVRVRGAVAVIGLVAIMSTLLTACGGSTKPTDLMAGGGWPGAYADARNAAVSTATGPQAPELDWSRPLGGITAGGASIAANGQMFVMAKTPSGCNLFSFEIKTARMRFCNPLMAGPKRVDTAPATPLVDPEANIIIGVRDGTLRSFNDRGQERWVMPVLGTPLTAQFIGDGDVLSVSHLGEVNVFNRQAGQRLAAPLRLLGQPDFLAQANVPWPSNTQGLDDCAAGKPACPVATTPAVDLANNWFYVTVWRPGKTSASVVALHYDGRKVTEQWNVDVLRGGAMVSPTLSADTKTLYVGDNAGQLIALDADDGAVRWTQNLGSPPSGGISVTTDGLIIPGGEGSLTALRDQGDRADVAWTRTDITQMGTPAQAPDNTAYLVARDKSDGLALLTVDTTSGSTRHHTPITGAKGPTVGTAIGPDGHVTVTTRLGEVAVFGS